MDYSRISEERKKLGWSQEELANKVGVSQKTPHLTIKFQHKKKHISTLKLKFLKLNFGVDILNK